MLRLEALLQRDPAIRDRAPPGIELRRGEAAAREADELNHLHQAEIARAHANVVDCGMVATALHKARSWTAIKRIKHHILTYSTYVQSNS
jgi:hypothetical protein